MRLGAGFRQAVQEHFRGQVQHRAERPTHNEQGHRATSSVSVQHEVPTRVLRRGLDHADVVSLGVRRIF